MRALVRSFVAAVTACFPCPGPVVEIGAFQVPGQESIADLRPLFPDRFYVGTDLRTGKGVDCVSDGGSLPFHDETVGTLLLMDTLEHVWDVQGVFREAHRVLRPGGILLASTVMNFPIHEHPWDYWRFTPEALGRLAGSFFCHWVGSVGRPDFPHTLLLAAMKQPGHRPTDEGAAFQNLVNHLKERFSPDAQVIPATDSPPTAIPLTEISHRFHPREWEAVRAGLLNDFAARFLDMIAREEDPSGIALLLPEQLSWPPELPEVPEPEGLPEMQSRATPFGKLWQAAVDRASSTPERLLAPLAFVTCGDLDALWHWLATELKPGGLVEAGVPNLGYWPFVASLLDGHFPIQERDLRTLQDVHSLAAFLEERGGRIVEIRWATSRAPEMALRLPPHWRWDAPYAVLGVELPRKDLTEKGVATSCVSFRNDRCDRDPGKPETAPDGW